MFCCGPATDHRPSSVLHGPSAKAENITLYTQYFIVDNNNRRNHPPVAKYTFLLIVMSFLWHHNKQKWHHNKQKYIFKYIFLLIVMAFLWHHNKQQWHHNNCDIISLSIFKCFTSLESIQPRLKGLIFVSLTDINLLLCSPCAAACCHHVLRRVSHNVMTSPHM